MDHSKYQYRVVPDARRPEGLEVYSVNAVSAADTAGREYEFSPLYGVSHRFSEKNNGTYWQTQRTSITEGEHLNEAATEIDIKLVDLELNPFTAKDQTLQLELTCFNRNQPKKLPSGNGQPWLTEVDGNSPVSRIACLVSPSATIRPPTKEHSYWRLVSHLNLNHMSLGDSENGCDAFQRDITVV